MHTLIALVADDALFLIAAGAAWAWWRGPARERGAFALEGILAAVVVGIAVKVAGMFWEDPRPFVVDHVAPLITHSVDNGFPSDHSALAMAVAVVVLLRGSRLGWPLVALSALLAWSRVAALVHHWPDVIAGALIGVACAFAGRALAAVLWPHLAPRLPALVGGTRA